MLVGLLTTLRVSAIGIVLATLIGSIVGIARLSRNWLVAKLASAYVETVRNIPLLLQLFFWYSAITGLLPAVAAAIEILPGVYLSQSGLMYPVPVYSPAYLAMAVPLEVGIAASVFHARWARRRPTPTVAQPPVIPIPAPLVPRLVAAAWPAV